MANEMEGIPDADLSPIMDQLKETQKEEKKEEPKQEGEFDLGQFKNPKDLLKSYKEIQAAFTKVTQENKTAKERLAELNEKIELMQYNTPAMNPQPQYAQAQQSQAQTDDTYKTFTILRISEVLEEEADKNRSEFQDRYAYAQMVGREYPNLTTTPKGVKKLFEMGDKLRTEHMKKNTGKALEAVFGEPLGDEAIARLRAIVKGGNTPPTKSNTNAYMPDTSTATRAEPGQNQNLTYENEISNGVKQGDVDGVIAAIFKRQLAE